MHHDMHCLPSAAKVCEFQIWDFSGMPFAGAWSTLSLHLLFLQLSYTDGTHFCDQCHDTKCWTARV